MERQLPMGNRSKQDFLWGSDQNKVSDGDPIETRFPMCG